MDGEDEMVAVEPSKERIFAAAIALFCERGYRETTVGDIEEAAGLTRRAGGFYRHFKSKDHVLVQAVDRMANVVIGDLNLAEVISLRSPRAEMLVIARGLIRHAEANRALRLLVQREGHKLAALRKAVRRANDRLAAMDVVPWVEDVLRRSNVAKGNARELALIIFGPVIVYFHSLDYSDQIFGLRNDKFLDRWADHWSAWLKSGG